MACEDCEKLQIENQKLRHIIDQFPRLSDGAVAIPGMAVFDAGCQIFDFYPLQEPHIRIEVAWMDADGHFLVDGIEDWYSSYDAAKQAKLSDAEN